MSVTVDEAARDALLRDEAKAAKLTDPDLLKIAKRGLNPADAIADLKTRFPTAFKADPVKMYSEMTPDERAAFARKHSLPRSAAR